jgi:hypothetical protein
MLNKVFPFLISLMVLILVIPSHSAYASIGTVTQQIGVSTIERTGDKLKLNKGTGVESMDTVRTGRSKTSIEFIDDTRVDVTENSKLIIDEFVYDPNTSTGKLVLKASFGTIRYASGQIAKNSRQNVTIRTPTAVIGVRGTDFAMTINEIGSSTIILLPSCSGIQGSRICVVGEIEVSSDVGSVILNQAFQATVVDTAKNPPFKPIQLSLDELNINNMLIIRRPEEIQYQEEKLRAQKLADFLGFDFLEFEDLNRDLLQEQLDENIWQTELDIDFLDQNFLANVLDLINAALGRSMKNALDARQGSIYGKDPETQIELYDFKPNWRVKREDGLGNMFELTLDQQNGYNINMIQGDFEYRDFQLGSGENTIDIIQTEN